jgi:hypothetical protein
MCDMFEQISFWHRGDGASGSGGPQGGGNQDRGGPSDGS